MADTGASWFRFPRKCSPTCCTPNRLIAPPGSKRFECGAGHVLIKSAPATEHCLCNHLLQGSTMKLGRSAGMLLIFSILGFCAVLSISAGAATRGVGDAPWGFSLSNLDRSCKPCEDFYQFAMGSWMKANPIPAEYPTWGTFTE